MRSLSERKGYIREGGQKEKGGKRNLSSAADALVSITGETKVEFTPRPG